MYITVMGIPLGAKMRFYNRERELAQLREMDLRSHQSSQMTVVVGRRRIGKTKLIQEAFAQKLYFFVSRKSEVQLCEEFIEIAQEALQVRIHGVFHSFAKLFAYLMDLGARQQFTLVIDEFQEFLQINPSVYSELQNLWDANKDRSRVHLVLCGSIYSLMRRIFEDRKEPLFGRAQCKIHLKAFGVLTLKEILADHQKDFSPEDLLSLYILTGGVAKYVELFVDQKALTHAKQLDAYLDEYSLLLDEGKNLLIQEFGKEYTTYFSILSLMSNSRTSRTEIESLLGKDIGGYLDRLENEYQVIQKVRPIFAKPQSRAVKYEIADPFLNFWFRFIDKNKSAIEIGNFAYVRRIIDRDFPMFSGRFLEKCCAQKLMATGEFAEIGNYWEKGNQNEIDIVAINPEAKRLVFVDVKRNPNKLDLNQLRQKSAGLCRQFPGYHIEYLGMSLADL